MAETCEACNGNVAPGKKCWACGVYNDGSADGGAYAQAYAQLRKDSIETNREAILQAGAAAERKLRAQGEVVDDVEPTDPNWPAGYAEMTRAQMVQELETRQKEIEGLQSANAANATDLADLELERQKTAEQRDQALAEVGEWTKVTGREDVEALDLELGRTGIDTHLKVLTELKDKAEKALELAASAQAVMRESLRNKVEVLEQELGRRKLYYEDCCAVADKYNVPKGSDPADAIDRLGQRAEEYRLRLEKVQEGIQEFLVPWRAHLPESWLKHLMELGGLKLNEIGYVVPLTPEELDKTPVCAKCGKPVELFKAFPTVDRWVHVNRADGREHDAVKKG